LKIYVSGTYTDQKRLRDRANALWHLGHTITGTWLHESKQPEVLSEHDWFRGLAVKDLAEVAAADCIILDLDGSSSTGGRYVEWGFALGRFNMLKITVGNDNHGVFNTLADKHYPNWETLLAEFPRTTQAD